MTAERKLVIRYSASHARSFPTPDQEEKVCEMWGKEAKMLAIGTRQTDGVFIINIREKPTYAQIST